MAEEPVSQNAGLRRARGRARSSPDQNEGWSWQMTVGLNDRFKKGGDGVIEALLASDGGGLNVHDQHGLTPLAWAAGGLMHDTVQRLIDAGADVNRVDRKGLTPLMQALGKRGLDQRLAQTLILAGTDLTVRSTGTGDTALHLLAAAHFPALVTLALERGADPEARTCDQDTPLHKALRASNTGYEARDRAAVQALLAAGAQVNAVNAFNEHPLACAVQSGCFEAATDLVHAGASLDIPCNASESLRDRLAIVRPRLWAHWEQIHMTRWAQEHLETSARPAKDRPRL